MPLSRVAPLTSSFLAASMLGFFISVYYVWRLNETWGFTFALLFAYMFIASMIAMRRGMPDAQLRARPKKE